MASPVRLPSGALPRYRPSEWAALVNCCRQPRMRYRFGLLLPGNWPEPPFPAGEGARWFVLPVGLLLLAPSQEGRWASCVDLERHPLRLGPFLLRWLPPVGEATARRRERERQVREARRARRGVRVPALLAVPNEGRAVRFGGRLSLSVSAGFLRQREREVRALARRFESQRGGGSLWRSAQELVQVVNGITAELEQVGEFAWVDVAQLRAWDRVTRSVVRESLVRRGLKPKQAGEAVERFVRPWQRSRPSQARRAS